MTKGIDVSIHQGDIDWKKVKSDSVEFAILRAGYGREFPQKDAQFEKNYAGCKANAIPVGAYWYSYALSVDEAKSEWRGYGVPTFGLSSEIKSLAPVYSVVKMQRRVALRLGAFFVPSPIWNWKPKWHPVFEKNRKFIWVIEIAPERKNPPVSQNKKQAANIIYKLVRGLSGNKQQREQKGQSKIR